MRTRGKRLVARGVSIAGAFALAAGVLVDTRAESNAAPTLETCAEIESESERLACYDSALRERERADGGDERPPAQTGAAPAPSASRAAAPAGRQTPAPANEERAVTVVEVRLRTPLPAVFRLQDGESWIQTDSRTIHHLQNTPFSAHIQPGALGSYFLSPDAGGPRVRVRRVE